MSKKGQGSLVVVSGFSGTGKGTVMKRLLEEKEDYALSVSVTTRPPREGEENGREYFFITEEQFREMIRSDELLEYATYVSHSYGTPAAYVFEKMEQGQNVLLEIDIQGALKVKAKYPEALLVFLIPPSAEELRRRLVSRGTEDWETIVRRLARAAEEADVVSAYDYVLVNDDLDQCVDALDRIVQIQRSRTPRMLDAVARIKDDLRRIIENPQEAE